MRLIEVLSLLFCLPMLLEAQNCPTPAIVQVVSYQRAAEVFLQNASENVDSVQLLLGDEDFRDPDRDRPDTVITFRGDAIGRGYNIFDLRPNTRYVVVARTFCGDQPSGYGSGELFRTERAGAPANDEPRDYAILSGAAIRCVFHPGTTRDATGPDLPDEDCATGADDDVWYNLRSVFPGYTVTVRPVGGTDQDLVVQFFDDEDRLIACVNDGAAGEAEAYELSNVLPDKTIRIRVFTRGTTGYADFQICSEGRAARPVADQTGCHELPPVVLDGTGDAGSFIAFLDEEGALVAAIENTQALGEVGMSYYRYAGDTRVAPDANARYAGRNVSIRPAVQPELAVAVRLYLTEAEVAELVGVGAIDGVDDLTATKVATGLCSERFPGGGEQVPFRLAGRYGDGFFIEVAVSGFSEFFIHPAAEPLATTTSTRLVSGTTAGWRYFPVPVTDLLHIVPPSGASPGGATARILSSDGKVYAERTLPPAPRWALPVSALPRGSYTLLLTHRGGRVTTRFVK